MAITFDKNDVGRYEVTATGSEATYLDGLPEQNDAGAGLHSAWADQISGSHYVISNMAARLLGYNGAS